MIFQDGITHVIDDDYRQDPQIIDAEERGFITVELSQESNACLVEDSYRTITENYTATTSDSSIFVDGSESIGNINLTLPDAEIGRAHV